MKNTVHKERKGLDERLLKLLIWGIGQIHLLAAAGLMKSCSFLGYCFGKIPWRARFSLLSAFSGSILFGFFILGESPLLVFAQFTPEQVGALEKAGAFNTVPFFQNFAGLFAVILLVCVVLSYWRNFVSLLLLKIGAIGFTISWCVMLFYAFQISTRLLNLGLDGYDKYVRDAFWFTCIWAWLPIFALAFTFVVMSTLSSAKTYYCDEPSEKPCLGDIIKDKFSTGGKDPIFTKSISWSAFYHFALVFIVPLLYFRSCKYDAYMIPKGDGAVSQYIQVVKPPKKEKKKEYFLNPNSPIIFKIPELDERHSNDLDTSTKLEYQATQIGPITGKKGKSGWPNGMDDGKIRFIRLEYSGGDWDQDMGKGADYNMLLKLKEYAGFNIAENTESIKISDLTRWKKNMAPPFVYLTGSGNINLNNNEVKLLRKYLLEEGGMLFADNGGGTFNNGFRTMIKRVLPELNLVDIANDDILYQHPFYFPNGAPPLWHHSGTRALGIKYNGRWIVYYHQGDINDAWKTGGSGVGEDVRERAFKLGSNVMAYAFTQYLAKKFDSEMGTGASTPTKRKK